MPKIKQLSSHEAQKIAAGEVVERPANIIKELVENSIDAHATRIIISVEDAGKNLIKIVDNGCGMDSTDAQACFNRHATSKLTQVEELESIQTFGFRGEALASIAAVSQITLTTKEENSLEGTQVLIDANIITSVSTIASVTGTDITVRNLFFNIPARKKFLKSTQTEWRAIQLLYNAFCFDYPHIHFSLFSDGRQVHNCPAVESLSTRAVQLWENISNKNILTLSAENNLHYSVSGIISDHQHYRYDKSNIYFFVNKRWVKNYSLTNALIKGYANVIPAGKYPIGAISITVPSNEVDSNIHPRKEEVKFLHPHKIEQLIAQTVKKTLEDNLSNHLQQNVSFQPAQQHYTPVEQKQSFTPFNFNSFFNQQSYTVPNKNSALEYSTTIDTLLLNDNNDLAEIVPTNKQELLTKEIQSTVSAYNEKIQEKESLNNYRIIGQYKKTYILIEKEDGLFLIDQHAAHERILYELFANKLSDIATVQLLFPTIITLSSNDIMLIIPYLEMIQTHGILVEQYSQDQLIVQAVPVHLKEHSVSDIIKEMISWIIELKTVNQNDLKKTINNKLQAQMACKAAVKAGDELSHEKITQLLTDLEKTTNRFCCPHGRPTGWLISMSEIEKKFKRKL